MKTIWAKRKRARQLARWQPGPAVEPYSPNGEANRDAVMAMMDEMPLWQVELIWEHGTETALQVIREFPTPVRAKAELERRRRAAEAARWALARPPG